MHVAARPEHQEPAGRGGHRRLKKETNQGPRGLQTSLRLQQPRSLSSAPWDITEEEREVQNMEEASKGRGNLQMPRDRHTVPQLIGPQELPSCTAAELL